MTESYRPEITKQCERSVWWTNVHFVPERRFRFFGRNIVKLVPRYSFDHDLTNSERPPCNITVIPSNDIAKVSDPELRRALQYQDAANTSGEFFHSQANSTRHTVLITATDEGFEGKMHYAVFTGKTVQGKDTFIENLKRHDPNYDGDYAALYG